MLFGKAESCDYFLKLLLSYYVPDEITSIIQAISGNAKTYTGKYYEKNAKTC